MAEVGSQGNRQVASPTPPPTYTKERPIKTEQRKSSKARDYLHVATEIARCGSHVYKFDPGFELCRAKSGKHMI